MEVVCSNSKSSITESSSTFFGGAECTVFTFNGDKNSTESNPVKARANDRTGTGANHGYSGSRFNGKAGASSSRGCSNPRFSQKTGLGGDRNPRLKQKKSPGSTGSGTDSQLKCFLDGLNLEQVVRGRRVVAEPKEAEPVADQADTVSNSTSVVSSDSGPSTPYVNTDVPLARSFISFKDLVSAVKAVKAESNEEVFKQRAGREIVRDPGRSTVPKHSTKATADVDKRKAERKLLLEGKLVKVCGGGVCVMSDKMQEAMIISERETPKSTPRRRPSSAVCAGSCSPRREGRNLSSGSSRGARTERPRPDARSLCRCTSAPCEESYYLSSKKGFVTKQVSDVIRNHHARSKQKLRHSNTNSKRGTTYQALFGKKAYEPQSPVELQQSQAFATPKKIKKRKQRVNEHESNKSQEVVLPKEIKLVLGAKADDKQPELEASKPVKKKVARKAATAARSSKKPDDEQNSGEGSPGKHCKLSTESAKSFSHSFAPVTLSQETESSFSSEETASTQPVEETVVLTLEQDKPHQKCSQIREEASQHNVRLKVPTKDLKAEIPPEFMFPELKYEPKKQQEAEVLSSSDVGNETQCDTDARSSQELTVGRVEETIQDFKVQAWVQTEEDISWRNLPHEKVWVPFGVTGKAAEGSVLENPNVERKTCDVPSFETAASRDISSAFKEENPLVRVLPECKQSEQVPDQFGNLNTQKPSTPARRDCHFSSADPAPSHAEVPSKYFPYPPPVTTPERRPLIAPLFQHGVPQRMLSAPWYLNALAPYDQPQFNHLVDSSELHTPLPCKSPSALHWLTEEEAEIILRIRLTVGKDRNQKLSDMKIPPLSASMPGRPTSFSGHDSSLTQAQVHKSANPAKSHVDLHAQESARRQARSAALKIQNCWGRYKMRRSQENSISTLQQSAAATRIQKFWRRYVSEQEQLDKSSTDLKKLYHMVRKRNISKFLVPPTYERFEKLVSRIQAATEGARVRRRLKSRRVRSMVNEIKEIRLFLDGAAQESPPETSPRLLSQLSHQLQQKRLQLDAALNCPGMAAKFLLKRCPATPIILVRCFKAQAEARLARLSRLSGIWYLVRSSTSFMAYEAYKWCSKRVVPLEDLNPSSLAQVITCLFKVAQAYTVALCEITWQR